MRKSQRATFTFSLEMYEKRAGHLPIREHDPLDIDTDWLTDHGYDLCMFYPLRFHLKATQRDRP